MKTSPLRSRRTKARSPVLSRGVSRRLRRESYRLSEGVPCAKRRWPSIFGSRLIFASFSGRRVGLLSLPHKFLSRLFHIFCSRPLSFPSTLSFPLFSVPLPPLALFHRRFVLALPPSSRFISVHPSRLPRLSSLHPSLFISSLASLPPRLSLAPHLRLIIHTSQPPATTTAHHRHRQYGIPLY